METNYCTTCKREYVDYCSYEKCPCYIKLVNNNFKEFIAEVKRYNKVAIEEPKEINFLVHCKYCFKMVDRATKSKIGFSCVDCKKLKYKKQVWRKNN